MTVQGDDPAVPGRVILSRDGGVLHVTLSNPERRNALTWDMYDQLAAACAEVGQDAGIRAVVLRGQGAAFAAGTDIGQFRDFTSGADGVAYEHRVGAVLEQLLAIDVPVLAVVDGPAVGAGLAIAACSDVIVASDEAVFGVPVARTLGNCIPPLVMGRLHERLGVARTMAMLLTAKLLSAEDAAIAGFVFTVVRADELDAVVADLTRRIVASAPLTLASLKEIDRRLGRARNPVDADDVLERCYGSDDFHEGVSAFLEHRKPQWTGH